MAQVPTGGNYVVDNSTGANVRADINEIYDAILTMNSGGSAPSYAKSYTFWADSTAGIMKMRNGANNAFINLFTLAGGIDVDAASNFNEDVTFQSDAGTIVFDKSAGDVTFADSVKVRFGASNDLTIFHDGSNSHIEDAGTGSLLIKGDVVNLGSSAGEYYFRGFENGAAFLRFDNSTKLETTTSGVTVTGTLVVTDDITLQDDLFLGDTDRIVLGDSNDLIIQHDATDSIIDNSTGNLFLRSGSLHLQALNAEDMLKADANAGVQLYFDNSTKLETLSTGLRFQNSATMDVNGGTIQFGHSSSTDDRLKFGTNNTDLQIFHGGNGQFDVNTGDVIIRNTGDFSSSREIFLMAKADEQSVTCYSDSKVELYYDNALQVATVSNGIKFEDSKRVNFGSDSDAFILHDNQHMYISNFKNNTYVQAPNYVIIGSTDTAGSNSETSAKFLRNGAVELYYDNSKKFSTESTGPHLHGLSAGSGHSDLRYNTSNGQLYYDSSTRLVKTDIIDSPYGIDALKQLKPRKYKRTDIQGTPNEIGFIADEVVSVIPEIVPFGSKSFYTKNASDTENIPINVDYRRMTAVLTKALQEAITKIETLETKVAALEAA